jgi:5-methylcytosine-specific restriction protein A
MTSHARMTKTTRITGRALQALRAKVLSDNPLCVSCEKLGVTALADEVDHILALTNGGSNDIDNLQGLCFSCHVAKTREDLGLKPVTQFDPQGRVIW